MLADKIENDLKAAMKSKDILKVETLRMLKAALHNFLIEKRKDKAEDQEIMGLIQKQIKSREDSIEGFKKGSRQDLVDKEEAQLNILQSYLPEQMGESEVRELVNKLISELRSAGKTLEMGLVMKEVMAKLKGQADGSLVREMVEEVSKEG